MPNPCSTTILLTGATGLLGRYLMADLLDRDYELAVLARGNNFATALQRVEQAVADVEQFYCLPRPRVLQGALDSVDLQMASSDVEWLKTRNLIVVHCAASIKFDRDQTGEPYRTNVDGTANLLAFCKNLQIDEFHYVSTAYVGCRTQNTTVFEKPVQLPEGAASVESKDSKLALNDYELSKIRSEAMVAETPWLGKRVIHRPSIVVGDSRTSYTSTFHGFYAPLKIGAQYAAKYGFSREAGDWFRRQLGLETDDSKNLVNVDWVARGIVKSVRTTAIRDNTIMHWTNPRPVACNEMQLAIVDSIREKYGSSQAEPTGIGEPQFTASATTEDLPTATDFKASLNAYASYFGRDPCFDDTNLSRHFSDLQCPVVDYVAMKSLADFALRTDFGWPRKPPQTHVSAAVCEALRRIPEIAYVGSTRNYIILQTVGAGACEQMAYTERGNGWIRCASVPEGEPVRLKLPFVCLANCLTGDDDIVQVIRDGRALIHASDHSVATKFIANWVLYVKSMLVNY